VFAVQLPLSQVLCLFLDLVAESLLHTFVEIAFVHRLSAGENTKPVRLAIFYRSSEMNAFWKDNLAKKNMLIYFKASKLKAVKFNKISTDFFKVSIQFLHFGSDQVLPP
jgi:hypothetical protein